MSDTLRAIKSRTVDAALVDTDLLSADQEACLLIQIKNISPATQIVILASTPSISNVVEAMRRGASDYIEMNLAGIEILVRQTLRALRISSARPDPDCLKERLLSSGWEAVAKAGKGAKGALLEVFCFSLFKTIPGWDNIKINQRRGKSEEHDLVILNESTDEFWKRQGSVILVECKNLKKKPSIEALNHFNSKLQKRRHSCTLGFFVSYSGFSREFENELASLPGSGVVISALDKTDLGRLKDSRNRSQALKEIVAASILGRGPASRNRHELP